MSPFKCFNCFGFIFVSCFFLVPVCPGYETINASRGKTIGCSIKLLQFLYSKPIVTTQDVCEELKISERTARDLIQEMTRIELLQEVTGYKRNRVYSFKSYLDLF